MVCVRTETAAIILIAYQFISFIQLFYTFLQLYTGVLLSYILEIYLDQVLQGSILDF